MVYHWRERYKLLQGDVEVAAVVTTIAPEFSLCSLAWTLNGLF